MKLKEKLAQDFALPVGTGRLTIEKEALHRGYLAGFEKARAMIQDDLIDHSEFCYRNNMPEAGTHLRSSSDGLNLLGEQEVDE